MQKQLVVDGSVRWTWCTEPDGYPAYLPFAPYEPQDYYHANSMIIDDEPTDDGETRRMIYVGLRNLGYILKIDYETKEVPWTLGAGKDFALTNGTAADWFYWLHDIQKIACPDGSDQTCLTIYDNGTNRPTETYFSRAVLMQLDETKIAPDGEVVWRYELGLSSWAFYRARRIDGCNLFTHAGYCPELE